MNKILFMDSSFPIALTGDEHFEQAGFSALLLK